MASAWLRRRAKGTKDRMSGPSSASSLTALLLLSPGIEADVADGSGVAGEQRLLLVDQVGLLTQRVLAVGANSVRREQRVLRLGLGEVGAKALGDLLERVQAFADLAVALLRLRSADAQLSQASGIGVRQTTQQRLAADLGGLGLELEQWNRLLLIQKVGDHVALA